MKRQELPQGTKLTLQSSLHYYKVSFHAIARSIYFFMFIQVLFLVFLFGSFIFFFFSNTLYLYTISFSTEQMKILSNILRFHQSFIFVKVRSAIPEQTFSHYENLSLSVLHNLKQEVGIVPHFKLLLSSLI